MKTTLGWIDRIHMRLDGMLASARFRRWAAAFPLTRPIARRRARALFDLCAGFVYSQVLLACVRLRVFEILAEGPQTVDVLTQRLALSRESAIRLLDAAVSLQLLVRRGRERYALGTLGATLVGNAPVLSMIEHHALLYDDLRDPVDMLRKGGGQGELAKYWSYAVTSDPAQLQSERVADYSALMTASQPLVADEVLDAYPMTNHRCLLDVGGGEGGFLAAVATRVPAIRLMLFDLPAVANRARIKLAAFAGRASTYGGSFLVDALPTGADIVSLVRVLHDHDDEVVRKILRAVRSALPPDGVLLVAEPMADTPGAEAMGDAYFGFYLLAMGSGRARTAERLRELLLECGFDGGRQLATRLPIQTRVIVAKVKSAVKTGG